MAKQRNKQAKSGKKKNIVNGNSFSNPVYDAGPAPAVSPAIARKTLANRQVKAKSLSEFRSQITTPIKSFAASAGQASNTVQTPASTVAELARALKDDADLIFYHVYNNIEFHPTYGLQKDSLACMTDGSGNAFDQCKLLVDLLTEAGYTASFLHGELDLSQEEVSAWLGTDSANIFNSTSLLNNGGIPNEAIWTGTEWRIDVTHVWVKVTIDSVEYILDPAFKTYSTTASINLATAMDYDQTDFLDVADDGATIDVNGNWIEDVNAGKIATELGTYTSNLISWIETNNPTATLDDIIGGRSIVQINSPVRITTNPYQKSGQTPTSWTTIPNTHRITVQFKYIGIDETLFGDEIHGKRITLFYNGLDKGELKVDGTLIATSNVVTGSASMEIVVDHPYAVTFYDQTVFQFLQKPTATNKLYHLFGVNFGLVNENLVEVHRKAYDANNFDGNATDEDVLGARLAARWHSWAGQYFRVADILGRLTDGLCTGHHAIGRCSLGDYATKDAAEFDIQGLRTVNTSLSGDNAEVKKFGIALSMHGYCLEGLAIAQATGNTGLSTAKILEEANANGDKIYKGTNSNWDTDVTPNLTGYNPTDLSNIKFWYLSNGWHSLISETAPVALSGYDASVWALINPDGGAFGIINTTFGGVGDDDDEPPCECPAPYSFTYAFPGMLLGSSPDTQLSVEPTYDSSSRYISSTTGLGWKHNWEITAREVSAGFKALGGGASVFESTVSIVEMFVHLDLLDDTDYPILETVCGSLCNSWWAEQLTNNAVVIQEGSEIMEFIRLPDDSYLAPAGEASTLVKNMDNSYTLTNKHQVVREFDTDGNLETVEFPNGVTITLTYSGGKLSTVSNGIGRTLTFTYTGDKLTSVSDGNNRSISFSYDVDDQLESITDPLGEDVTFTYSDDGLMESYFLPENPLDPMVTNTYDSADRIESQLDMNDEETKFYFAGWRSEVENALGHSIISEFDANGNKIKQIDELGNVSTSVYDGLNRLIQSKSPEGNSLSLTYDAKHNVLTSTVSAKPGSTLNDIVETFTYNSTYNKVATYEDGRGNTTTYTYDSMTGNLLKVEKPDIDSQTPTVTMTYNSRGQVLTVEDETGIKTKFEYDTTTEVLDKITLDEGVGRLNLVTEFDYSAWGDVTSVTDPRGNETTRTTDKKRRVAEIEDASPFSYITKFTYDKNDNRLTIERETGDVGHPWQVFEASYNIANQVVSIKDPLDNEVTKQYDALRRLWKETDPESRVIEYQYDERGNLKKVIDPDSVEVQVITYTANGLQNTVEDANGNVTQYFYDGFDRSIKTVYPDGSSEEVEAFDANGNITSSTNRAADNITYEFDVLNRLIERDPVGMPTVSMDYDLAGRLTSLSTPVVSGNPASGEWEFSYDTAGRFTSEEAPDGKTVSYEIDDNGNIAKITYPDSYYVERVYDELNRLTDIKLNGSTSSAAEFDYDNLSRMSKLTFGNGVVTDYGFEWNDNLSSIEKAFTGSDLDFTYSFNDANELTNQTISDSQHMWHPTTDSTNQFGSANNLNQIPYSTASCGRLFKGYNKNGCLTDDGVWQYEYDNENQMISAVKGSTTVDYVYDPQHRQIQKNVDGTKTRYVYSGWQRIADYDGALDTLQSRYVYGASLDEPLIKVSSGGVLTYMHSDSSGSVVALTDNTGAVTNRYAYSPWGESDSMSGTTFGYTGQRYDSETGLYYYKNRYYSPELGRFLQVDPLGYEGGMNSYEYANNNPMSFVDSYGLLPGLPYRDATQAAIAGFRDHNLLAESQASDAEHGFHVYETTDAKGNVVWMHTKPVKGTRRAKNNKSFVMATADWVKSAAGTPLGATNFNGKFAKAHVHPNHRPKGNRYTGYEDFSEGKGNDMEDGKTSKVDQFLQNADGWILFRKAGNSTSQVVGQFLPKSGTSSFGGGFATVVIDPGCGCKKKGHQPTPHRTPEPGQVKNYNWPTHVHPVIPPPVQVQVVPGLPPMSVA